MAKAFQTDIIFKGKVDSSFQKAVASIGKQSTAITKKLGKAAVAGFAAASVAAAGFSAVAVKSAVDFQAQMSNVGTLLSGTQQEVAAKTAAYSKDIKRISGDTGASTELLTDGMYQVVSAFGEVGDASKILEISAKAATAGNATVTDSVNLLSAVTKGYNDVSAEANQKAADLAFNTVKLGQTTFPELAASMGKVIPLAATMKTSQEDLFGAFATLTGVTGGAAEVATQLRGVMQGFLQPTAQMSAALNKVGYASGDAMIAELGLQGTLEKLKESVGGNEQAFANLFGSVEAKNAVLAMTGAQAQALTEKTQAMYEATGAAQAAFDTQTDNFAGKMNKVKAKLNVLAINAGETLLPVLAQLADKLLAITNSEMFANLENQLGYLVNGFSAIFGEITSALSGINLNFAIDGLGDFDIFAEAAQMARAILPPIVSAVNAILPPMMQLAQKVLPVVINVIQTLLPPIMDVVSAVLPAIMSAVQALLPIVTVLAKVIGKIVQAILPAVIPVIEKIGALFRALEPIISFIANVIGGAIIWIFNLVSPVIDFVFSAIQTGVELAIMAVEFVINKFNQVKAVVLFVFEAAKNATLNSILFVINKFNYMKASITMVFEGIKLVAIRVANDIIDKINAMIAVINKIPGVNIPLVAKVEADTSKYDHAAAVVANGGVDPTKGVAAKTGAAGAAAAASFAANNAAGGTYARPLLTWVAEEPGLVETIVPHRQDARSRALAMTAALGTGLLGRLAAFRPPEPPKPPRMGGGMTKVYSSNNQRGGDVHITYAPVIHAEGGEAGVKRALDKDKYAFAQMIEEYFKDKDLVTV